MPEFSAILSAVKPRHRTDQYVVLAALYFLGANETPVTSRQVTDLLKLHKSVPSNVSASLRSYSTYVERADASTPIKWHLTTKGIDQLRKLSGLELTAAVERADYDSDIAFVCALEHPEFTALQTATGGKSKWEGTCLPEKQGCAFCGVRLAFRNHGWRRRTTV